MASENQTSSNLEILMFKIMKSGFYYTNPKRKKSIKPLKVLFKYKFTIKSPKNAIMSMVFFPMIFRPIPEHHQLFGWGVAFGMLRGDLPIFGYLMLDDYLPP